MNKGCLVGILKVSGRYTVNFLMSTFLDYILFCSGLRPLFFGTRFFLDKIILDANVFGIQNSFNANFIWTHDFLGPNLFFDKVFLDPTFFGINICLTHNFLDANFFVNTSFVHKNSSGKIIKYVKF